MIRTINRTIDVVEANVMFLNIVEEKTHTDTVIVPIKNPTNESILAKVMELYAGAEIKPVHVLSFTTKQYRYTMLEDDFIKNAERKEV